MIYECPKGHICFSKDNLVICGRKECNKTTKLMSPVDIDWFYKINKSGLCIDKNDIHMIIEDKNMPQDVKKQIEKVFSNI